MEKKTCDNCGRFDDCRTSTANWKCHDQSAWEEIEEVKCSYCGKEYIETTSYNVSDMKPIKVFCPLCSCKYNKLKENS